MRTVTDYTAWARDVIPECEAILMAHTGKVHVVWRHTMGIAIERTEGDREAFRENLRELYDEFTKGLEKLCEQIE
jgi:hypothetical protein